MKELQKISYRDALVLTTEQLAEAYACTVKQLQMNFANNKERFREGVHFFKLEGQDLSDFKASIGDPKLLGTLKFVSSLMLWTKRGAARHSKMLGTDRAWDVFEELEESYFTQGRASYLIEDSIERAKAWIREEAARRRLAGQVDKQSQLIGELKPKADYTDRILRNPSLVAISQIAKDYGISGKALNAKLHALGIIYRCCGQWLLYSKYQAKGYTHSETVKIRHGCEAKNLIMHTKWTQKGRLFLYERLKKEGILPLIEREQPVLSF